MPTPAEQLRSLAADNARAAASLLESGLSAGWRALRHPSEAAEDLGRTLRGVRALVDDAARPAAEDPLARASSGLSRRFDVLDVPIERLRKLRAPLGATINDVVLAALTGALRAYYEERDHRVDTLKCMVPMNLRGRDERDSMGNRVGVFNVHLPVGEASREQRLLQIREQTRAAKQDQRGAAGPVLMEALAAVPVAVIRRLAQLAMGQVNVACTNVPGTPERRYMGGAEVESIYPFASVVQGTPLVVALLSYAATIHVGIDSDPEAIPDPQRIPELFDTELAQLEALA